ncbi:response regulator [Paenibacillus sp. 481]|uniref:response regulator n=1 Tax=Paenibacillus sp. 481 TaxID=2835869 RepID=UPI001E3B1A26|nr:response regulator [Paenibacillus sp. 481]UHA74915.1 response regulator [Paenibacillus sp. 481]
MSYRIVVVDDELPALDEMEDLLKDEQLASEVMLFAHAERALEWAIAHEPDIVLLDIQMPGLNGLTFAERLLDARPMVNVVFVTAYNQYAVQAFELSAVDYILKPVKKERLNRTLERIHRRRVGVGGVDVKERHTEVEAHAETYTEKNVEPRTKALTEANKESAQQVADNVLTMAALQPTGRLSEHHLPCIYSLGRLQVEGPLGKIKWRTIKVEELFAYLLFKGSATLDQIINDVFPNSDPDKAKTYVHTCVYQIRRAIAEISLQDYIHVSYRDRLYKLVLTNVWHDTDLFMESQSQSASQSRHLNVSVPEQSANLYRGDWCEGLDGIWMTTHREDLRQRYLWLMEDIIDDMQKQGDFRKALIHARQLIKIDSWNEHIAARIVELYVDNGEKARAKQFIQQYREQYESELGGSLSEEWHARIYAVINEEI